MEFSKRIGKTPATKEIQLESIDEELKNGLWNLVILHVINPLKQEDEVKWTKKLTSFANYTWHHFYKLPIDTIPYSNDRIIAFIKNKFYKDEWFKIYDFIEHILKSNLDPQIKTNFIRNLNKILEREFSGYRIINNKVAPISNKIELEEISNAISETRHFTASKGANIHLDNALSLISDKNNPDYRNSIKESISAVEATCRQITKESTLGKALKKLESKGLKINRQLGSGFEKIYAYTNDKENGIRHAIVEQPNEPDFNDAKYMLVACCSFINYLIGKANEIGVEIE